MCFFLVKSSNVAWLLTMPLAKCIFKLFLFCCCCCCYFPLFLFFGHTVGQLGSQFPDQGSNSHPLQWKRGVLTAGPLQKSLNCFCVVFKNTNSRAISLIKVCLRIWKKKKEDKKKRIWKNQDCALLFSAYSTSWVVP